MVTKINIVDFVCEHLFYAFDMLDACAAMTGGSKWCGIRPPCCDQIKRESAKGLKGLLPLWIVFAIWDLS